MTSDLETGIAEALARRACQVPDGAAARVQQAVVTARPGRVRRSAVVGASVVVAATAAAVASTQLATTSAAVAVIGSHPRLAINAVPPGFGLASTHHVQPLPGQPVSAGAEPQAAFVHETGSSQQSIGVVESPDGQGWVPKIVAFASSLPAGVTETTSDGRAMTIVDLAAAAVGTGTLLYFDVSGSTWALVSGTPGVTVSQLVAVADGIVTRG